MYSAVAVGADGRPLVVFGAGGAGGALRLARCEAVDSCENPQVEVIDANVQPAAPPAIAIGDDGHPVIAYVGGNGLVRIARCGAANSCSTVSLSVVESAMIGSQVSVVMDADGRPVVAYATQSALRLARCAAPTDCSTQSISTIVSGGSAGFWNDMALGADGRLLIAFGSTTTTFIARCESPASCIDAEVVEIDPRSPDSTVSLAIQPDGRPMVAHDMLGTAGVNLIRCESTVACDRPTTFSLAASGDQPRIALAADGLVRAAYRDADGLKVVNCGNPLCSPHLRPPG